MKATLNILRLYFHKRVLSIIASAVTVGAMTYGIFFTAILGIYLHQRLEEMKAGIQITAFLEAEATSEQAESIAVALRKNKNVKQISVITAETARLQFEAKFGSPGDSLLPTNPFPATLTITPADISITPKKIDKLTQEIAAARGVDEVRATDALAVDYDKFLFLFTVMGGGVVFMLGMLLYATARGVARSILRPTSRSLTAFRRAKLSQPRLWLAGFVSSTVWFGVLSSSFFILQRNLLHNPELNHVFELLPQWQLAQVPLVAFTGTTFLLFISALIQSIYVAVNDYKHQHSR